MPGDNIYTFVGLAGLFYFGVMGYRAFFSLSPVVKSQARTILIGALLAFGPIVIWLLYSSIKIQGTAQASRRLSIPICSSSSFSSRLPMDM